MNQNQQAKAAEATPEPEPAETSGSLDQDAIDALMKQGQPANEAEATPEPEPAETSGSLDQDAIDALMKQGQPAQAPDAAAEPEPAEPSGSLDQAAIDALMKQNASPQPAAGDAGNMDQAAIDALLAGQQTRAPSPPADAGPAAIGEMLEQNDIDALIQQHASGGIPRETAAPESPLAQIGLPDVTGGAMDQDAVDQLLEDRPATHLPAKKPARVPNPLGAATLSPEEIGGKMIKSWTNSSVTGIRRSRFFTSDQVETQGNAIEAIERLFTLANAFRDSRSDQQRDDIASVANRYGQQATIQLTRDRTKPIRIKVDGIKTLNTYQKLVETSQTYHVDRFVPNQGSLSRHWVDWFTTNFDSETLQNLSSLT